jgi:hypothetical protein
MSATVIEFPSRMFRTLGEVIEPEVCACIASAGTLN